MLSAGIDARKGWLQLCKDYFRFGYSDLAASLFADDLNFMESVGLSMGLNVYRFPEDAYALVQKGRLDGWYPDADLYEYLIAWMCTQEELIDVAERIVRQELQVCLYC